MNIALLHWGFPPIIGGVETHLSLLGPELVKMGHKVSLLTGNIEGLKTDYDYHGMKVKRSPLFDLNWLDSRGFDGIEKDIEDITNSFLNEVKPDIIHCHNMHYFSKLHSDALGKYKEVNGIPLILTAHNVWDEIEFIDLSLKTPWDHVIAVSEYIKSELIAIGIPESSITVVHHGIDVKKFENASPASILRKYTDLKDRQVVFHPARMSIAKGCDVSIKALRLIKEEIPNVMLVLTGTKNIIDWGSKQQKEIAYMLYLAETLGLKDDVLIEMIPMDVMPKFYNLAAVSIYPSTAQEPFGITMLESLAAGVPMVVTNAGGMPEIIEDGVNGFIVDIKDYRALALKCTSILKDGYLRERLGKNGRRLVELKHTKEAMTENTLNVYKKFVSS